MRLLLSQHHYCPTKDTRARESRFSAFSGRDGVLPMHPELERSAILVSGHHGFVDLVGNRIIMDMSGGKPTKTKPLSAIVLPERRVVTSTTDAATC